MNLKALYIAIPAIAIILLNLLYGSAISWMFSVGIIACLLYFFTQISIEQLIYRKTNGPDVTEAAMLHAAKVIKKYKILLSAGILTVVFLSSVICIYRTTNPGGSHPYFFNNDYHTISNSGIAFDKDLELFQTFNDSLQTEGSIRFIKGSGNKVTVQFNNFYEPVFVETDKPKVYTPVNNIFPQLFTRSFSIYNSSNNISVTLRQGSKGFFSFLSPGKKNKIIYDVAISSNDNALATEQNIKLPYNDHLQIETQELSEGKSLYNLLLNSTDFSSDRGESYAVMEFILRQLGETYLLVNNQSAEDKAYSVFPAYEFLENGYHLKADDVVATPHTSVSYNMPQNKAFYIGFHNAAQKNYLSESNNADLGIAASGSSLALMYDYPASYPLTSPATEQETGNKNQRFISNNKDDIITSNLKEGFYFNNEGLKTEGRINGSIAYLSQTPNSPLVLDIKDNNLQTEIKQITDKKFSLQSSISGQKYLFSVRDFSQNGFHFHKIILFLFLIYLGMLAVLIYFPGKNLVRIEPVIFAVIYLLLALRFILYWRLATFPPLENISKYELENTILNFDYRWGIHLPVPLTFIWTCLFLGILAFYRYRISKGKSFQFSPEKKWNLTNGKRINLYYVYFIGLCAVIFFANNAIVHLEILTRIVSIIIPVAGYSYFAMLANKHFTFEQDWISAGESRKHFKIKAYFHYFIYNPTFIITLLTIGFFALTDRGFAILFTLFILLKNIFFNFLKKPFDSSKTTLKRMIFNPNNYWIYGILSLIAYLAILSFKSLFYYLITYKLIAIGILLLIPTLILFFFYKEHKKITKILGTVVAVYALLLLVPPTRNLMEAKATSAIKHVQYRASIIHQPLSQLLSQNAYSSFQTQKIIETAENQWFINSYISKPYDNDATINLRPYSRVGVNYNTQTRDVVIARFVIGELGNFTMYLLLVLTLLPLILYLISYRLTDDAYYKLNFKSYIGILPLLLFFTLSLFVWLTATNRFVFFGQDFPFLSLTSKLSVVLPLLLFGITLTQQPNTYRSYQLNLKSNFARYVFFTILVTAFAITTIKSNELEGNNFSIVVEKTKGRINDDLNAVMTEIQDSLDAKHVHYSYSGLMKIMAADKNFNALLNDSVTDNYTKSILLQLVQKPSTAIRIDNPLYITYNGFQYSALYNEHLYLHLPPVENKSVWNGTIVEKSDTANRFALNKWINGRYEILYPLKGKNFWLYHFANAIRNEYDADTMLRKNVAISLDYQLGKSVQDRIDNAYGDITRKNRGFRFSVIAADGDGNIRIMNDFVTNRRQLDPNDNDAIDKLQQKHFFFSNIRNERDQWGNSNLIALHLGPGSSIKPLTTAAITSQVNAGWEALHMQAPGQMEYQSYAGFKLLKPWENDDHYRSGYMDISRFLEVSSNFYQSVMIFLGSYPRESFIKNNTASIKNVLTANAGSNNAYPLFEVNGYTYHLPNYNGRKGNWPATDAEAKRKTFFGNENSILANGMQTNAGLHTKAIEVKDTSITLYRKASMLDSVNYHLLSANKNIYYLWSMPEHSSLLQSQRSFKEAYQNFNIGLKTTTLGGYPYQVTPYKMLEMYLSLFSQNRNFGLSVIENAQRNVPWKVDTTWKGNANFNRFLATNVFKGMNDVIYGGWGTAHGIGGLAAAHPGYFIYAKTGTINEQGSGLRNSRRLIVMIANKNMQQPENIGKKDTKLYAIYFAIDNNKDFDWSLLNQILNETMASASFVNYFK